MEQIIQNVKLEEEISSGCNKNDVWSVVSNFQNYPYIMDNVKCVTIENVDGKAYSTWDVDIDGAPITWKEVDNFDIENGLIQFEALEGDFFHFKGNWKIHENDKIKVSFEADYCLGVPQIEKVLGHIIREKLANNIKNMLKGISTEVGKNE